MIYDYGYANSMDVIGGCLLVAPRGKYAVQNAAEAARITSILLA